MLVDDLRTAQTVITDRLPCRTPGFRNGDAARNVG
jgi:hypothetical protein